MQQYYTHVLLAFSYLSMPASVTDGGH